MVQSADETKIENGAVKVIKPLDSSPALEAGIRTGDTFTKLDGVPLKGLSLEEVVAKFCGALDSVLVVTLTRETEAEAIEVKVKRKTISITPFEFSILDDVAWIKIRTFDLPNTFDWLKHTIIWKIQPAAGSKLKGYILDLRDNSGGLLDQAGSVAGAFLESGTVVVLQQERNATERKSASGGDLAGGKPVVVLINQNTASGAEIVASSLQHEHRAAVVGSKSFGAGTVQTVIPLDSQHAIKLTTAKMLRANGPSWDGKGIEPDVIVPAPAEPAAKEQPDPGLAAALDILRRKQ